MPSASNAQWNVEVGQILRDFELLTDSGDHKTFNGSAQLWSSAKGKAAVVLSNGIRNGFAITPKTGTNDAITYSAGQANLNGVVVNVSGGDITSGLTRPSGTAGADSIKHSIILNSSGTVAVQAGTEGTAFSTTRGAAGGPPLIAIDAIELGQVWLSATSAAPILTTEIFQVPGEHQERADTPLFTVDRFNGRITYVGTLPLIHTGSVARRTYAKYYTPIYLEIPDGNSFQPPTTTKTQNSTSVYKRAIGSVTKSLAQGSITILLQDGVRDPIMNAMEQDLLWQEFYPDANDSAKWVGQAHIAGPPTYPADNNISVALTLSAEEAWQRVG